MNATLIDESSGAQTLLTPGIIGRDAEIIDEVNGSRLGGYADSIQQSLPLSLLGLSDAEVPVEITATDVDTSVTDSISYNSLALHIPFFFAADALGDLVVVDPLDGATRVVGSMGIGPVGGVAVDP